MEPDDLVGGTRGSEGGKALQRAEGIWGEKVWGCHGMRLFSEARAQLMKGLRWDLGLIQPWLAGGQFSL